MEVIHNREDIHQYIHLCQSKKRSIGFVPTMGALHAGHMSLIDLSKSKTDQTIASIFVNPKQFNNPEDLTNYPVSIEQDLEMLEKHGCDAVFIPTVHEIYGGENYVPYRIDIGNLGRIYEAEKRPGHFDGVVEILHLLFELIQPDAVFFGLKDYQQVMVVEKLLQAMHSKIKLFKCPIVRESDGLAISSRNRRLSPEERKTALEIYATLKNIQASYPDQSIETLKNSYINHLNCLPDVMVDYLDIVDYQTINPITKWNPPHQNLILTAVFVGKIRLIDNLLV